MMSGLSNFVRAARMHFQKRAGPNGSPHAWTRLLAHADQPLGKQHQRGRRNFAHCGQPGMGVQRAGQRLRGTCRPARQRIEGLRALPGLEEKRHTGQTV